MAMEGWVEARAREFAALQGRRIRSWRGVEMALRQDVGGNGPQFTDPDAAATLDWGTNREGLIAL